MGDGMLVMTNDVHASCRCDPREKIRTVDHQSPKNRISPVIWMDGLTGSPAECYGRLSTSIPVDGCSFFYGVVVISTISLARSKLYCNGGGGR